MCGIVGYTGKKDASRILLDGLSRLEYRGYDSAGMTLSAKELKTFKAKGKVKCLEEKVQDAELSSYSCGIAHTRWATHGAPLEKNAHPHLDASGRFAVVHNGIIENYASLRKSLEDRDIVFLSDTDSEVIPNLIAAAYHGDFLQAVATACKQLIGTYGIAVVSSEHPGIIICARMGSPIVIGVGMDENMVASDVTPLVAHTQDVIYLNDGDMAILTPQNVELRTLANVPVEREISQISWDVSMAGKSGFEHFMLKEIHEQPQALADCIRGRLDENLGSAVLSGLDLSPREMAQITRVVIAACGSSLHAGIEGEYFFEDIAGIPCETAQAAEFRYRNPILEANTLVIPISQSGETADTLAAVREAINKGAVVTSLCNVVGSTIARECGRGIYLHAGPEISVASTKAFTCQVTLLLLFALMMGRNRRLNREQGLELIREIKNIPSMVSEVLKQEKTIAGIAEKYASVKNMFYIGRGCLYPTALEGALKMKEISYIHAEGYHAAELKHGPIALLEEDVPVVALANEIPGKDKMLGNIQECLARKSPVIAVVTGNDDSALQYTSDIIRVPESSRFTAPITTTVALQLLAYYSAKVRGCEIDCPRNLAKSVTVE